MECQFCHREFNRPCTLAIHERTCKDNPNRRPLENHVCNFKRGQHSSKSDWWICKVCGLKFRVRSELFSHMKEMNHKCILSHPKELHTCKYCGKEWLGSLCGFHNHENHCKENPCRLVTKGRPHSEEERLRISEKRKEYLATHKDEHVWKRYDKFTSVPCNDLKEFLRSHNYSFLEEVTVIPERNFSVDICFPDKMIVVEVNGNKHYDTQTMELSSYYQERHDLIESYGWTVIEVPYNKAYSEEFRNSLCKLLDGITLDNSTFDYKFECVSIHEHAKLKRDLHDKKIKEASLSGILNKNGKLSSNKISLEELTRRKNLILNSGVDLTKFGWVSKVTEATELSS